MAPRHNAMDLEGARRENGQSTVEFGLTLLVLILFLMIFFDFGRGIYAYSVITEAAQEGARYAIVNPTDTSGIIGAARQRAVGLDPDAITVSSQLVGDSAVEVQVQFTFVPITPIITTAINDDDGIPLTSTSRMCRGVCLPGS